MKKFMSLCILLFACKDDRVVALEKRVEALEKKPSAAQAPARPDPNVVVNIPLHDEDVSRGRGKLTIVEAFDFACPYCAMSSSALDQLVEKYPNDVRVVSKQFVVHPDTATLPALATCAAQKQGKGPAFEQEIWKQAWGVGQSTPVKLNQQQLKTESLDAIAQSLKLDLARFRSDRDGGACKNQIERDQREMASIGVRGTPAIYINGKQYQGPRTLEGFEAAIKSL